MQKTTSAQELRISVRFFFIGVAVYLATTLILIVCKFIFWNTMNGWWILLPPLFVTSAGILDVMIAEISYRTKSLIQTRRFGIRFKSPF
jgi:hypothetical protein